MPNEQSHYSGGVNMKQFLSLLTFLFFINTGSVYASEGCDREISGIQLKGASTQVINIIERIMSISNDHNKYIICASGGFDNAAAVFDIVEGKRYIIYDPIFIHSISSGSGDYYWTQVAIFAHEIGHQILGHVLNNSTTDAQQRELEIHADQFAGSVLAHWGASLSNSQALMRRLKAYDHGGISDHPKSDQRIAAATLGWKEACATLKECNTPRAKSPINKHKASSNKLPSSYTATQNYDSFIQQANKLKGALINSGYCKQYVLLAVAQANKSIQYQCGYEASGYGESKQWSLKTTEQFDWCMGASAHATEREAIYREKKLAECIVE